MPATYSSSYGATRPLTAPQKLAEMAVERRAAHDGLALPSRFWLTPAWRDAFGAELRAANRLLKVYQGEALFRLLAERPDLRSLIPRFVATLADDAQGRLGREHARAIAAEGTAAPPADTHAPLRPPAPSPGGLRAARPRRAQEDGGGNAPGP